MQGSISTPRRSLLRYSTSVDLGFLTVLQKDSHWLSPASLSETEYQHCIRRAQLFTPGRLLCFDTDAEMRGYDNANVVTITDSTV